MDNVQISWFKLLNQINYLRLFVCFLVLVFTRVNRADKQKAQTPQVVKSTIEKV